MVTKGKISRIRNLSLKSRLSRTIRIYVSTHNEAMERERLLLQSFLKPRLHKISMENGWKVQFVDLRCALAVGRLSTAEMIQDCLREASTCDYFIGIIGSKYGWCPDKTVPEEWSEKLVEEFPWLEKYPDASLEELEVRAAAFEESVSVSRLFFNIHPSYRSPTEPTQIPKGEIEKKKKMRALKDSIREKFAVYNGEDDIYEMQDLLQRLVTALKHDFASVSMSSLPGSRSHEFFYQDRLRECVGREQEVQHIMRQLSSFRGKEHNPLIVAGDPGIGKSSVMVKLAYELSHYEGTVVISHFVGSSVQSLSVDSMIERIFVELCNKLYEKAGISKIATAVDLTGVDAFTKIITLARHELARDLEFYFVIDGIDEMIARNPSDSTVDLRWLPVTLPANVYVVISRQVKDELNAKLSLSLRASAYSWPMCPIVPFSQQDAEAFIRSHLTEFSPDLSNRIVPIVLSHEQARNPLHARFLLREFARQTTTGNPDEIINSLLEFQTFPELVTHIIQNVWAKEYAPIPVEIFFQLLASSRAGLSDNHLKFFLESKGKVEFAAIKWETFICAISMVCLAVVEGRYVGYHHSFVSVLRDMYYVSDNTVSKCCSQYVEYLETIYGSPKQNITFQSTSMPDIYVAEICRACCISKQYTSLAQYLSTPIVVEKMLLSRFRIEFFTCWAALDKNGFDHRVVYAEMIKEINEAGRLLLGFFKELNESELLLKAIKHRLSKHVDEDSKVDDYYYLGWAFGATGKHTESYVYYLKYLELVKKKEGPGSHATATAYNNVASILFSHQRYQDAVGYYRKSLEIRVATMGADHPSVASLYDNFGLVYSTTGNLEEAQKYYSKALSIRKDFLGDTHVDTALSYQMMGLVSMRQKKYNECIEYLKKCLEMRIAVLGENHAETTAVYYNLGCCYEELGLYEDALRSLYRCARLRAAMFGRDHPSVTSLTAKMNAITRKMGGRELDLNLDSDLALAAQSGLHASAGATGVELLEASPGGAVETGYTTKPSPLLFIDHQELMKAAAQLVEQERYGDALEYYERCANTLLDPVENASDYLSALSSIADVHFRCGRLDQSLESYKKVSALLSSASSSSIEQAIAHENVGKVLNQMQRYEDALSSYTNALDLRIRAHGVAHELVSNVRYALGGVLEKLSKYQESMSEYREALRIRAQLFGEDDASLAEVYFAMGAAYQNQEMYAESLVHYEKSLQCYRKKSVNDDATIADMHYIIAVVSRNVGKIDECVQHFDKSLAVRMQIFGEGHKSVVELLGNMATIHMEQEDYEKAIDLYKQILQINLRVHGNANQESAQAYMKLASVYEYCNMFEHALSCYEQALHAISLFGDDEGLEEANIRYQIANLLKYMSSFDEALQYYKRTLQIRLRALGDDHPDTVILFHDIAVIFKLMERYDDSLAFYSVCLEKAELDEDNIAFKIIIYHEIGIVYVLQERDAKSADFLLKALDLQKSATGELSPEIIKISCDLASVYETLQMYDEALETYQSIVDAATHSYGEEDERTSALMERRQRLKVHYAELQEAAAAEHSLFTRACVIS